MNVCVDGRAGVDHYAIGQKGSPGATAPGATRRTTATCPATPSRRAPWTRWWRRTRSSRRRRARTVYYWMVAAQTWAGRWDGANEVNAKIVARGPEAFIERTRG